MSSMIEPELKTRRWRRIEYERLVELGVFTGERLELLAPLALDDASEPEPDVAVVSGEPAAYRAAHPGTAALVVEVADSSLRLDRRLKAALYARNRLQEYWIVNLADATLEVARDPRPTPEAPESWRYAVVEVLRASARVSPLGAPGSVVAVSDLLP